MEFNLERIIAVSNTKTVYRDGFVAVKVFDKTYEKSVVLREAMKQSFCEKLPVKVPKIMEVTTIDGQWAIAQEYVKSKTLAQLMEENPQSLAPCIAILVEVQLAVQACEWPLAEQLKDSLPEYLEGAGCTAEEMEEYRKVIASLPETTKLYHGDVTPSNILIENTGGVYVVDWGGACRGDAASDVACTYLHLATEYGRDMAVKYLNKYVKMTGMNPAEVEEKLPLMAAMISVEANAFEKAFLSKRENYMVQ